MDQKKSESDGFPEHLGKLLLVIAWNAIAAELDGGHLMCNEPSPASEPEVDLLEKKLGVFVTLHHRGELRGCIGTLEPVLSLAEEVVENARHAAFHDPRFSPLTQKEFLEIAMEISVLTPPRAMDYTGPEDLKNKLKPGIHGVILERHGAKATFLPQVWDQLPEPEVFLEHLCRKAGLSSHAWKDSDIAIQTYTVHSFKEKGF
jgi:AmmeMemoRadiSam system protein A